MMDSCSIIVWLKTTCYKRFEVRMKLGFSFQNNTEVC